MKVLDRATERRIKYLAGKYRINDWEAREFDIDKKLEILNSYLPPKYSHIHKRSADMLELFKLFKEYEFTNEEAVVLCSTIAEERNSQENEYKVRPVRPRKDNKDFYNGSGGYWRNTVRYPKKKRKTAWVRFYKLFPNLDPKNKNKQNT